LAQECDREEKSPKHLWEKACELGFVGVFIPETYGGPGLGFLEHCLINEEFWRVDPGIAHFILAGTFWLGNNSPLWHRGAKEEMGASFGEG